MKICLMIFSNRPDKLERLTKSLSVVQSIRHRFEIAALIQPPYTGHEPFLSYIDHVGNFGRVHPPTPFLLLMRRAMELVPDADVYWSMDDDQQFADPNSDNATFNKSNADYYRECFDFLEERTDVGVLSCKGYLGGYSSGYDFVINPANGLIATADGGLFFRNIGIERIISDYEMKLVGALAEQLCAFNIIHSGLKFARRFNASTKHDRPRASEKHVGGASNISYSDETVSLNIERHIRQKWNDYDWTHSSKKYPEGLKR